MKVGDLVDATTPFESYLNGLITHIDFSRKVGSKNGMTYHVTVSAQFLCVENKFT